MGAAEIQNIEKSHKKTGDVNCYREFQTYRRWNIKKNCNMTENNTEFVKDFGI